MGKQQSKARQKQRVKKRRIVQDSPLDRAVLVRDGAVLDMVRDAIRHKEVLLAYQPIVRASNPKSAAFFEGLIRVLDETGRVIPAKDFMHSVEDTETGRELDCLALEKGLRTLKQVPNLRLSINMSARSIGYRRWNNILNRAINARSDIASRLVLEISEPSAMQVPELVMDFMDELQPKGIAFALDDYGSNLTSFKYFKDFFFDIVKIDGQFTQEISKDLENQVIAGAMANIARQFDIFTVATRVASIEDANTLNGLGFDCLQGYLFGAPTVHPPWGKQENSTQAA
ncbi:MAG: EAL domain-containing protein [Cognatishimia sp.]|uniref:EAL domain-containing protein n=1 Tax=Cognatishimia sp. TaxID=2211648 RepID=UPI003B8B448A